MVDRAGELAKTQRGKKDEFLLEETSKGSGINITNLKALTEDKKKWKKIVQKRLEHQEKWERSKGHKWTGLPCG